MPYIKGFRTTADLVKKFKGSRSFGPEKMAILAVIWDREVNYLSLHWCLRGIRRGWLFVKADSAPAAHELKLKSGQIVRSLNKHFRVPWIKGIRVEY